MSNVLSSILPTTEVDAVNVLLSVIGESPLLAATDLSAATASDVVMGINMLKEASRNVQMEGWRFNTEWGYQLLPFTTFSWVDTAGVTTLLNIFKPPAGLAKFSSSTTSPQVGAHWLDVVIRPSRKYVETALPVLVFYDRTNNRDGLKATDYPFLSIDPTWFLNFVDMPEEARTYITVLAARRFAARVLGSDTLVGFTQRDEGMALRALKREHGLVDGYNIFSNAGSWRFRGGRRSGITGVMDRRGSAGPT